MYYALFGLHLVISLFLCVVVLLQQSKGGGLAGAFGAGGGEALFGARGVTTFLHKATIYLGAAFMLSSVLLVVFSASGGSSGSLRGEAADRAPQPQVEQGIPLGEFEPAIPAEVPATGDATNTTDETAGGNEEEEGGQ